MGKGNNYLSWLTEEEQSKWIANVKSLGLITMTIEEFLNTKENWMSFICGSFPFTTTPEGADYWINIYCKYKKYDNLNVKKGFNSFNKQPKIL